MARFPLPPAEPSTRERWSSQDFRDELTAWCEEVLGGPVRLEQHKLRAWSTVWKVHDGSRLLFAKQNCSSQNFEAALVDELSRIVPDHVVPPVAVDRDRGFLLADDQGPVLGDGAEEDDADEDVDTWCQVVRQWAEVQRAVLPHVDRLGSIGVSTMAVLDAEEYVAERTAQVAALPPEDPRHLPAETAREIEAHLPVIRGWSEQVAALGLPMTLNHNDLHAHNVFADGTTLRFFDFGDSLVTEPLAALLIPLIWVVDEPPPDDPRLEKVASAFLEVWSDVTPIAELRAVLPAALQLARLCRHESWVRTMPPMTDAELSEWGEAAPRWLATLLEDPPLT